MFPLSLMPATHERESASRALSHSCAHDLSRPPVLRLAHELTSSCLLSRTQALRLALSRHLSLIRSRSLSRSRPPAGPGRSVQIRPAGNPAGDVGRPAGRRQGRQRAGRRERERERKSECECECERASERASEGGRALWRRWEQTARSSFQTWLFICDRFGCRLWLQSI